MMNMPDELKEILLEPSKKAIAHLESNLHMLNYDEIVTLEKLKFAIKMYELEKAHKEGRLEWN